MCSSDLGTYAIYLGFENALKPLTSLHLYQHTYCRQLVFKAMSETDLVYEKESDSDSTAEGNVPRRPHKGGKGGKHPREEPTSLAQLQACPLAMDCFRYQSRF